MIEEAAVTEEKWNEFKRIYIEEHDIENPLTVNYDYLYSDFLKMHRN